MKPKLKVKDRVVDMKAGFEGEPPAT